MLNFILWPQLQCLDCHDMIFSVNKTSMEIRQLITDERFEHFNSYQDFSLKTT